MQLGDLIVETTDSKPEENFYDVYNISLSGINYKYYPSQAIYIKSVESYLKKGKVELEGADNDEYNRVSPLLEDVVINLTVKMVNPALKDLSKGKP